MRFSTVAPLALVLALPVITGCSAAFAPAEPMHDAAWAPPPASPCAPPAGETLEHWRRAAGADLVVLKTLDGEGNFHMSAFNEACTPLDAAAVEQRLEGALLAEREAQVESVPDARIAVQVWLGSRRELEEGSTLAATDRERTARFDALPQALRRFLQPLAGSFAYVGVVSRADALALARHEAVRLFYAYPALAEPAAAQLAAAVALPESEPSERGGMAVFDECASEASGAVAPSFAAASGVECLVSSHGTRVSRLAYEALPVGGARWAAGLTAATTDAPESIAAPAVWALARRHAGVMVQTIHTTAGEGANDGLDMLIAEAAYPDALVVRASGNGSPADAVVHRVLGALDVGAHGPEGAPLPSARAGNAATRFGDVERPAILDDGVVVDEEGGSEGTSFAAPRMARLALGVAPSAARGYAPLARRAQVLAAARSAAVAPGEAVRTHEDGAFGSGLRGAVAVAVNASSEAAGREEGLAVGLPSGARVVRELRVPFEAGARVKGSFALVFEGAPQGRRLDPTRSAADLDLRVLGAPGRTLATSQSFDDDQEVATVDLEGGATIRVAIEQASATPARRAVLAWRFRKAER